MLTFFSYGCSGGSSQLTEPIPGPSGLFLDKTSVAVTHHKGVDPCPQVVGTIIARNIGGSSGTLIASGVGTSFSVSAASATLGPPDFETTLMIRFTCHPPASATASILILLVDSAGNTLGSETFKATVTVV